MSGIFGIVHLDGSPVPTGELESMRSAMQEWGPDGGRIWSESQAGLGSLMRFETPEATKENLPLESQRGFVLTAEARLDNRPELCEELRVPSSSRDELTDGQLILAAYEAWADSAPQHILGDWSFATWDAVHRELFLARDHSGNTSLYFYQDARRFAFASSRKALYALGIPRRLDESYLASVLVSWPVLDGSRTIDLDVHRLPPAHSLRLQGKAAHITEYWHAEDVPSLHLRCTDEYAEGLLAVYDRAVKDRLRSVGDLGVLLSGGLDSGSAALLAARQLEQRGLRLSAYTSVPSHRLEQTAEEYSVSDERSLAEAIASAAGNVDLMALDCRDDTPIEGIRRSLAIHQEPTHGATNSFWIQALLASARKDGVKTVLTGQGGNGTISWAGTDRARLLRNLLKSHEWKRAVQLLLYPHLPLLVLRTMRQILHRGSLDWSRSAISPKFARRIDLSGQYLRHAGDSTQPEAWYRPEALRRAIIRTGASHVGGEWAEIGAAHSLEIRDPTWDKRVMEFALSIPEREYTGPDGTDRWMIRSAMKGLMPDGVRLNRRQGLQAADIGLRLTETAAETEQTLSEIERCELAREYLAIDRMRQTWELVKREHGPGSLGPTVTILMRGMMAGLYLVERDRKN